MISLNLWVDLICISRYLHEWSKFAQRRRYGILLLHSLTMHLLWKILIIAITVSVDEFLIKAAYVHLLGCALVWITNFPLPLHSIFITTTRAYKTPSIFCIVMLLGYSYLKLLPRSKLYCMLIPMFLQRGSYIAWPPAQEFLWSRWTVCNVCRKGMQQSPCSPVV